MGYLDPGDWKVVPKFLNDVNDATPGQNVSTSQVSGSIIQPFFGQVGKRLVVNDPEALKLSDTTIGTLFGGIYQYVQTAAGSTTAPARGGLCFWSNFSTGIVTPDAAAGNIGMFAGVYLSAPTKGNYCVIQIGGRASVQLVADTTKDGAVIGNIVVVDVTPTNTADILADATAMTMLINSLVIGRLAQNITGTGGDGAIVQVVLKNDREVFPGIGGF